MTFDYLRYVLAGSGLTLGVSFGALALGTPLAFVLAAMRMSRLRVLRWPAAVVVELFRGTPGLVQLFWAFYVLPLFGVTLDPVPCAILILGVNHASYFSEVVRGAIDAVPRGQVDAAFSVHLTGFDRYRLVVLPQALPLMVPSFANAAIDTVKYSSVASLVTVNELTFRGITVLNATGDTAVVLGTILLFYFAVSIVLSVVMRFVERLLARWTNVDARVVSTVTSGAIA